jgi:hypothetical protein
MIRKSSMRVYYACAEINMCVEYLFLLLLGSGLLELEIKLLLALD